MVSRTTMPRPITTTMPNRVIPRPGSALASIRCVPSKTETRSEVRAVQRSRASSASSRCWTAPQLRHILQRSSGRIDQFQLIRVQPVVAREAASQEPIELGDDVIDYLLDDVDVL